MTQNAKKYGHQVTLLFDQQQKRCTAFEQLHAQINERIEHRVY